MKEILKEKKNCIFALNMLYKMGKSAIAGGCLLDNIKKGR